MLEPNIRPQIVYFCKVCGPVAVSKVMHDACTVCGELIYDNRAAADRAAARAVRVMRSKMI